MIENIFATCIPSQEKDVTFKIKKMPDIVEINRIMCKYDIFFKVSVKKEIDPHTVITSIRDVQDITGTATFVVTRGHVGTIDEEK
jgi:hypothetical protein